MFTIALPKGALLEDSISIFKRAGFDFSDALEKNNRSLTFESNCKRAKALLVRNGDVPVYVSYGQADLGIVGYDVLRESELKVAKLLDLRFGGCHMSLAVKKNSNYSKPTDLPANCKIAFKYKLFSFIYLITGSSTDGSTTTTDLSFTHNQMTLSLKTLIPIISRALLNSIVNLE